MSSASIQACINHMVELATEWCGQDFKDQLIDIKREREIFLNDHWFAPGEEKSYEPERVIREIDFDTIINLAAQFLDRQRYHEFQYEIANLALQYGQFIRGEGLYLRLLESPEVTTDDAFRARINSRLGDSYLFRSDYSRAIDFYSLARTLSRQLEDQAGVAESQNALGIAHVEIGKIERAKELITSALQLVEAGHDTSLKIQINMNLANISNMQGDFEDGLSHLNETMQLLDKEDQAGLRGRIHHNMGIAYKSLDRNSDALEHFDAAITMAKELDDVYLKNLSYLEKAEVFLRMGKIQEGTALVTTAFQAFSEFGDRLGMADAYKVFGKLSNQRNQRQVALSFFKNSLRIGMDSNSPMTAAETQLALAEYYGELGETELAVKSYRAALEHYRMIHAWSRVEDIVAVISRLGGED